MEVDVNSPHSPSPLPFHKCRTGGSERESDLPGVPQLVSGRPSTGTQQVFCSVGKVLIILKSGWIILSPLGSSQCPSIVSPPRPPLLSPLGTFVLLSFPTHRLHPVDPQESTTHTDRYFSSQLSQLLTGTLCIGSSSCSTRCPAPLFS